MSLTFLPIIVIVLLAWTYDFYNGMNDCANSIATSVSTRALTPRQAIFMAFLMNILGAFITTQVAKTIGKGLVDPAVVDFYIVIASLVGAIGWSAVATHSGIPISITHALVGGIVGAVIASHGSGALEMKGISLVVTAMIISPVAGFFFGFLMLVAMMRLARYAKPYTANQTFRRAQILSAAFMALSHGANDTQNAMGIITMALVAGKLIPTFEVPKWVILGSAFFMGLGTYTGGWNVIRTMGIRVVKLHPVHGFSAETSSAIVILLNTLLGAPISTTHVISTAIVGVGAAEKPNRVNWGTVGNIVVTWILTIPGSGIIAAIAYRVFRLIV
ncbi:MAG: anion permease [Bacteroidota bacterium]